MTFILKYGKFIDSFAEKIGVVLQCKNLLDFCSKIINVFENTLATTVDEFDINELVKLMML